MRQREQSEAVAHDNASLRAELARVQTELAAAVARRQEAAEVAASELAALQQDSAALATRHEACCLLRC